MDKIIVAYETLQQACRSLHATTKRFIAAQEDAQTDKLLQEAWRDSVITRFQLCYELLWKYGKHYLLVYLQADVSSPKKVFQELHAKKIISREDADNLMDIVEVRNLTTHIYDEAYAEQAAQEIIEYLRFLETILKKLAPEKAA